MNERKYSPGLETDFRNRYISRLKTETEYKIKNRYSKSKPKPKFFNRFRALRIAINTYYVYKFRI